MKKIKKILTIILCALCSLSLHAQKENYNWAFGASAGLSWETTQNFTGTATFGTAGGNVSLSGIPTNWKSAISTSEGCFSVSSYDGQLMFYSDGISIWNKNNVKMPNGTDLSGNPSSAQSGIIIPYPGQGGKFIAFTVSAAKSPGRLEYSVVDMSLEGGLGDVVASQKNIPLTGSGGIFGEALTAVRHANYRDYWVVATARDAANIGTINVWKVDLNGVHNAAESSISTGLLYSGGWIGYMRFNSDGSKFWQGNGSTGYVLANFNTTTGDFSNLKTKTVLTGSAYGAEFSPNGQYVYATHINGAADGVERTSYLYAWNFDALMAAADISTVTPLKELSFKGIQSTTAVINDLNNNSIGVPLMGSDGRMYVSNAWTNSMFVIPNPDSNPADLKIYKLNHILDVGGDGLGERNSWGLPVYAAMYFNVTLGLPAPPLCMEKEVIFNLGISGGAGSDNFTRITIDWGDGSPLYSISSPTLNTSYPIAHTYEHNGDYTVRMTSYDNANQPIVASSSTQAVHVSNCRMPVNPNVRSRMDGAVLINGVYWAKANVDAPGTFPASPESPGMLYQWNRKTAWAATGTVTGWDSSYSTADSWQPANDPCPPGYRIPTDKELSKLYLGDANDDAILSEDKTVNGITGVEITDIATGNSIFLPTVSWRESDGSPGTLSFTSYYWSSTPTATGATNAVVAQAWGAPNRGALNYGSQHRAAGLPCRCVAE